MEITKFKKITILFLFFSITLNLYSASGLPDFTDLIKKNSPTVVNISTVKTKKDFKTYFKLPPGMEGTPHGDLFRKFFEDQIKPHSREALSLGSGLIISEDGFVITNNHVISEADKILVRLSDKREFPAKLIGADKATDLALLKINARDLPYAKLGDSDSLQVGEWVIAIGSPFGFEFSSTAGIVSAKGRSIGNERYVPFIQTDVAINPGNSGGPLFNLDGEVIGINAQILSKTGGYLGLSFAIPVNVVKNVVTQLKSTGYVKRGWLGIGFQQVNRDIAKSFGLDRAQGALVANVVSESPAEKAGIKTGDIILKFNRRNVLDADQLPSMVGALKEGDDVEVTLYRSGKEIDTVITIGALKPENVEKADGYDMPEDISAEYNRLGVLSRDLRDDERKELKLSKGGVIVTDIEPDSIAENIGLVPGDIIVSLNMKPVTSNSQFNKLVKSLPKEKWVPILVKNQSGVTRYFPFKITR